MQIYSYIYTPPWRHVSSISAIAREFFQKRELHLRQVRAHCTNDYHQRCACATTQTVRSCVRALAFVHARHVPVCLRARVKVATTRMHVATVSPTPFSPRVAHNQSNHTTQNCIKCGTESCRRTTTAHSKTQCLKKWCPALCERYGKDTLG